MRCATFSSAIDHCKQSQGLSEVTFSICRTRYCVLILIPLTVSTSNVSPSQGHNRGTKHMSYAAFPAKNQNGHHVNIVGRDKIRSQTGSDGHKIRQCYTEMKWTNSVQFPERSDQASIDKPLVHSRRRDGRLIKLPQI